MMKRTKIICTIGPASDAPEVLLSFIKNGMNVARLNFSHGTHESHKLLFKKIRAAAKKAEKIIGIMADLQGPKIRFGDLGKEGAELKNGAQIILTTGVAGKEKLPVTYSGLHKDVKAGERLLLDDGLMELKVVAVRKKDIICKVINGGRLSSHKGINCPDSRIALSSLTEKDRDDLKFAMAQGADFVALSFVRSAKDVKILQKLIAANAKKLKCRRPRVIVKIEKGEALENFISILALTDAVMVARGDLAIETPAEDVPLRQKEIVALCRQAGKPVIVATQMLDSMIRNPRPTRAEVSDVANAVMDSADAVMLSGESAGGKYPIEAVKMMVKIITETEDSPYDDVEAHWQADEKKIKGLGSAVNVLAREAEIDQIVDLSPDDVWQEISKGRPEAELFVNVISGDLYPCLFWGVLPFLSLDKTEKEIIRQLKKEKQLKNRFILVTRRDALEVVEIDSNR
jgi:pyruvate kinase